MRLFLFVLLIAPAWSATCTLADAATYASWAATSGHWSGGGCGALPATGDIIVMNAASNPVIHIASGESVDLGSSASGVGDAFTINGTSASVYASLIVDYGGTLTARGFDRTTNRIGNVARYAHLTVNGALVGGTALGTTGTLRCYGICAMSGSSGQHATVTSAAQNWNTTATPNGPSGVANNPSTSPSTYWRGGSVYIWQLTDTWVANAGGTGIGSSVSSSVSFSSVSCSPACTGGNAILSTEVSSLTAVNSAGKYFIDYPLGLVYWWQNTGSGATVTWTAAYKTLTYTGWYFDTPSNVSYNSITASYTDFSYVGPSSDVSATQVWLLYGKGMQSNAASGSTSRVFGVANCTFSYVMRPVGLNATVGTAADPILITDNSFGVIGKDDSGGGYGGSTVVDTTGASSYVTVARNSAGMRDGKIWYHLCNGGDHLVFTNNIIRSASFFDSTGGTYPCSDCILQSNIQWGTGASLSTRSIGRGSGVVSHPFTIDSNLFLDGFRWADFNAYQNYTNNIISAFAHHGLMGPLLSNTIYATQNNITGNLFTGFGVGTSAVLATNYNTQDTEEGLVIGHNTVDAALGYAGLEIGNKYDSVGPLNVANLDVRSNMITNSAVGVTWSAPTAGYKIAAHVPYFDYNNLYNNTAQYSGWAPGTFSGITNVTGVALQNPSYVAAFSGKTLTYTYTSATDITLTWDGGTPVQLVMPTNGTGTATSGTTSALTDSGKTWTTAQNNGSYPGAAWVCITAGTNAGSCRRILSNTATTLTTGPPNWASAIDNTSVYVIYLPYVTLTAADASTVVAGIYAPSLAVSTQTDAAVGMTIHSTAINPYYANTSRTWLTWDASRGGAGTEESVWAALLATPSLTTNLVAYLRAGYIPTNLALKNRADAGTDPGALAITVFASPGANMSSSVSTSFSGGVAF